MPPKCPPPPREAPSATDAVIKTAAQQITQNIRFEFIDRFGFQSLHTSRELKFRFFTVVQE
jgi:hypothetical protein